MKSDLELIITDTDLERMQIEVDEALRMKEERRLHPVEENTNQTKSA